MAVQLFRSQGVLSLSASCGDRRGIRHCCLEQYHDAQIRRWCGRNDVSVWCGPGPIVPRHLSHAKGRSAMSNESLLMTIVVGGVAGWLAGLVMRGSGYGVVGDIVVGLLGAFVGNWLLRATNFSLNLGTPVLNRIVVALVGAVVLMFAIGMLRPRSLWERTSDVWRRR